MSRTINLFPLKDFKYPIAAENITPDTFHERTIEEIRKLEAWEGNKPRILAELFNIEETRTMEGDKTKIVIQGSVREVRRIGKNMTGGDILINGDSGAHLGEGMKNGCITVRGNVDGWTGSMMKGGTIEVYGNAGDYLAAPCRGSTKGMGGGRIIIHGNVGNEAGAHMRKGLIRIEGEAGQFLGFRMRGGTMTVKDCGDRAGACMIEGKIIISGFLNSVLPTFTIEGMREKVKVADNDLIKGPFYIFVGDLAETGQGKLYVSKDRNPHLSHYEKVI